jgi:hypothetical protein
MLNVIDNYFDCKYIDSYWLNNIVKAQNEDRNKYKLNNKFEIKIDIDYNENREKSSIKKIVKYNINNKYILENMFTGKGNSTNSANSNNSRLSEMVKPTANGTRLSEMIKRDPQVGIIAASWSRPDLK